MRDDNAPLASTVFDLHGAIEGVVDEMPVSERGEIDVVRPARTRSWCARARHELLFCVRSLLAYLGQATGRSGNRPGDHDAT